MSNAAPQVAPGTQPDGERMMVAQSLRVDLNRRAAALAISCPTHEAWAGEYCFGSAASGVRGVCAHRWDRGALDVAANGGTYRGPFPPGALTADSGSDEAATDASAQEALERERERELIMRHPNRQGLK